MAAAKINELVRTRAEFLLWLNRAICSRTLIDVLDNSTKSLPLSWAPHHRIGEPQ
jgi:hypothetical protein